MTFHLDARGSTNVPGACLLALFGAFLFCGGCGIAPEQPYVEPEPETELDPTELVKLEPGDFNQTWQGPHGRTLGFGISIPPDYTDEKPVPLVVCLHYGAPRFSRFFGNNLLHKMIKPAAKNLNAIIIAPDVINKTWTNFRCEESTIALVRKVSEIYRIDPEKVLIIGFSMGAEGAWQYSANHPKLFTAAIPVSGHPPDDYRQRQWQVPTLAIHSRADEVFPYETVYEAVNYMDDRNAPIQLYTLEGISHFDTTRFNEPLAEAVNWVQQLWESDKPADPESTGDDQK